MNFAHPQEVVAHVSGQPSRVLAGPWTFERSSGAPLQWRIHRPGEDMQDYLLEAAPDLGLILIYWGNSDAGAFAPCHALLSGSVISAEMLDHFPRASAVARVIEHRPPNVSGLT